MEAKEMLEVQAQVDNAEAVASDYQDRIWQLERQLVKFQLEVDSARYVAEAMYADLEEIKRAIRNGDEPPHWSWE